MFKVNFSISIPSFVKKDDFQNLFCYSKLLTKYKAIEFEVLYYSRDFFVFEFSIDQKRDHGGLIFTLGLFGYSLNFQFYDTRHWDIENDDYEIYEGF